MVAVIIFMVLTYALLITLYVLMRANLKHHNPKHGLFDDFLLFSGTPLVFGYLLFLFFNPFYADKIVLDLINTPLTHCLMAWLILSNVILIIRYKKNCKATENGKNNDK